MSVGKMSAKASAGPWRRFSRGERTSIILTVESGELTHDCRVSLKTKLSANDLNRLLNDVRRRVEFEITFEGTERRIKYVI